MTRTKRRLLQAMVGVTIVGAALVAARWSIDVLIENKVRDRGEALGIDAWATGARLRPWGLSIQQLCALSTVDDGEATLCLQAVDVRFPLHTALGGAPAVSRVSAGEATLSLPPSLSTVDGLSVWAQDMLRPNEPDAPEGSGAERSDDDERDPIPTFPEIEIDTFRVALATGELPTDDVHEIRVAPRPDIGGIEFALAVRIPALLSLPGGVFVSPNGFAVQGHYGSESDFGLQITGDERVEVSLPGVPSPLRLRRATVRGPATLAVDDVEIAVEGVEFEATALEVSLRELTTRVEDLYLADARLDEPRVSLDLASMGLSRHSPRGDESGPPPGAADGSGEGTGGRAAPSDEPGGSNTEREDAAPAAWDGRKWWERIPQQIRIADGVVEVTDRHAGSELFLSDLNVHYALRAIRTQLDVEMSATLGDAGGTSGSLSSEIVWDWAKETLDLSLDVDGFKLTSLRIPSPLLARARAGGLVDIDLRYRERDDGSVERFEGRILGSELGLDVPNLSERLLIPVAEYAWEAGMARGTDTLVFERGVGQIGLGRFELTPTVHGFDRDAPYLAERVDVAFSVPEQAATTLLYAVPEALLGPMVNAHVEGTLGMDLEFPVEWTEADEETGRRGIDIGAPSRAQTHDEDLHLVSLPDEVDVRRFNRSFSFTFAGPDGEAGRQIDVPPPRVPADPFAGELIEEDAPTPETWARLDDISYYLIAATLYREDGRFFTNSGINWYQWRSVLEQAWDDRRLGRGASTITMQTIKNVFLTHERTLERKFQELFLTYWMTRLVPKERILEVYLNIIEWGPGINGVVEAADYYFGKRPGELSLAEAVWLSSIVPSPIRRGAQRANGTPSEWSMRHCRDIMNGMRDRDWITATELAKGLNGEVRFVTAEDAPAAPTEPLGPEALGLDDLRVTVETAAPTNGDSPRLSVPPPERTRMLIEGQLELRP